MVRVFSKVSNGGDGGLYVVWVAVVGCGVVYVILVAVVVG